MTDQEPLNLKYPDLLTLIGREVREGHSESRAFLVWVLRNLYRLDDIDAEDAICDGPDDKGVDGIYVDDNENRIDVFQSRIVQNPDRTLGDVQLKEFVGSLTQFATPELIQQMADTTDNPELRGLLIDQEIANRVNSGYAVRGVFVTNADSDENAAEFLPKAPNVRLIDGPVIRDSYVPAERPRIDRPPFTFDVFGVDVARFPVDPQTTVVLTAVLSTDLVRLEGLASGELFAPNVRQWLGRTKVNKDIAASISDHAEHRNFVLYHNGVTFVCSEIDLSEPSRVTIAGYFVINGCQSLTSLYENRTDLTPDLRIFARFVQIPDDPALIDRITLNSNNQNGIKHRDLKSNNPLQIRLQREFERQFPDQVFYEISRGERSDRPIVIDNELAARILLAFDLLEPWSAHQAYRLFDDLYSPIFGRPEVDAERIWAQYNLYRDVVDSLSLLEHERFARYTLTKYFLLYLVAEALATDGVGQKFLRSPTPFLRATDGLERLNAAIKRLLADFIVDLNAEIREREESGNPLDYKRELKSPTAVRALSKNVISSYAKLVGRGRSPSFSQDWEGNSH